MKLIDEINRRRTFAIISHPDAGKTTLTEKLLLFGGAIQVAGAVKSNKIKKGATSDFMEIERQRGISVATSVMGFEYKDVKINILDTPGHQDFAEDTYRTLSAVDSVIVVIDVAKGVETQTEKLVAVCRMRDIPIIVFINKMDRNGKEVFDLLDEVEQKLGLKVSPLSWPIGMGSSFLGVYNMFEENLNLFSPNKQVISDSVYKFEDINDPKIEEYIGDAADALRGEMEMVRGIYPKYSREDYLSSKICPVFFGSALNNFGVQELLDCFIKIAPVPGFSTTQQRKVQPEEETFSGFVFKIHANIDPKHRNRIAFVKVCSGKFERNKNYMHVGLGKQMKFSAPTAFMAEKKSVIDEAFPGDIVGLPDAGNFKIGDTITEGEMLKFIGIPTFAPELFRYIENGDPLKSKQLAKGVDQLMDEGVAQLFTRNANNRKIIGTVGALQFEVIEYRLLHEYGAKCVYQPLNLYKACWVRSADKKKLDEFKYRYEEFMARDKSGRDVFLADSAFRLQLAQEKFPDVSFMFKAEIE